MLAVSSKQAPLPQDLQEQRKALFLIGPAPERAVAFCAQTGDQVGWNTFSKHLVCSQCVQGPDVLRCVLT